MANDHPTIPVIELAGTPEQIGAAHGEAQRENVREFADVLLGWLVETAAVSVTEESLWTAWAPQLAVNERWAPELVAEMRGISRGSGVPFERVFLINSLLDLMSFRYLEMARGVVGCTTFAVATDANSGKTLVGQTYDMPGFHQRFATLLRITPREGPRQLVFTFAGVVGACGLNEAGIGLSINYLSPLDVGRGRLHSLIVRRILAADNLADALTPQVVPRRAGGAHYLVGDREGNLVSIETTGHRHAIFYAEGNAIGHTNHYLDSRLKEVEYIREASIGSSLARYGALRRFFRQRGDDLDLESLRELTRNHTSFPRSICAHGTKSEPAETRSCTVAAMVHELADATMHIAHGCACENDYHPVTL